MRWLSATAAVCRQVGAATNMPIAFAVARPLLSTVLLTCNLTGPSWFGPVTLDSSALPIITMYATGRLLLRIFIGPGKHLSSPGDPSCRAGPPSAPVYAYTAAVTHGVGACWCSPA